MPKVINLRNPQLCRDIRELAALTGKSLTATVHDAALAYLEHHKALEESSLPQRVIPVSAKAEDRDP